MGIKSLRTTTRLMLPRMVLRSLWNNLRISAWTLLTLAMCAALVTLFTTVTFEVRNKMSHTLRSLGANAVAYPAARAETRWTDFEREAQGQGVRIARLSVRVGLIKGSPVAIVAAPTQALQDLTPYWAVTGKRPTAQGECLAGRHVAQALGLQTGQTAKIEWPAAGQATSLAVVGIVESGDEDDDRVFVASLDGLSDLSYVLLSVPGGEPALERLRDALATAPSGIEIKPLRQVLHGEEHVLNKVSLLCLAALVAVLALTALGVSASMLARVAERKKEFALLQALGATRRSVVTFVLAESATVGGLAAVSGFGLGTLLAGVIVRQVFKTSTSPHVLALAAALVVTTAVTLLAGAVACRRMVRLQPAMALRGE